MFQLLRLLSCTQQALATTVAKGINIYLVCTLNGLMIHIDKANTRQYNENKFDGQAHVTTDIKAHSNRVAKGVTKQHLVFGKSKIF